MFIIGLLKKHGIRQISVFSPESFKIYLETNPDTFSDVSVRFWSRYRYFAVFSVFMKIGRGFDSMNESRKMDDTGFEKIMGYRFFCFRGPTGVTKAKLMFDSSDATFGLLTKQHRAAAPHLY